MKKIIFPFFTIVLLFTSCHKTEDKKTTLPHSQKNSTTQTTKLEINTWTDFPEELDGPGCSFHFSKKDYEKGINYVYADNLDSICYLKINRNFIRFELVDYDRDTLFNTYRKKFKSNDYELSVDLKKVDEVDEVDIYKGSMSIKQGNKSEEKKELYGVCGC